MYALSTPTFWARFFSEFRCHQCGSPEGYVSRPRNLFERYGLRLVYLRAARCGDCYSRSYRPASVALMPRPKPLKFNAGRMFKPDSTIDRKVPRSETLTEDTKRQHIA
jgi:hypothetical protein